jgi:hypothetical protein
MATPFLTLDISIINIVYAYFRPFCRDFYFLNNILLFYQVIVLFEFLFKNRIAINSR